MSEPPPKDPAADEPAPAEAPPGEAAAAPGFLGAVPPSEAGASAPPPAVPAPASAQARWAPLPPMPEIPEPLPALEIATPGRPYVTGVLAAANIGIWILTVALGASVISPSPQRMFELGGNLGAETLHGAEWRLFTSMFLHFGVLHLAMNMVGLIGGGRLVERLYGRLGFSAIYLISGLAGSLASALRPDAGVVSAGASGAIFGVLGALGAYYALHRERMDQSIAKEASGLLVFVAYNIVFGFTATGVDMYAHLGGLAAGFVCGLAIEVGRSGPRLPRTAAVAGIGLIAVLAGAFLAPAPANEHREGILAFAAAEAKVMARWEELVGEAQRGTITDDRLADAIEQDILSAWREAHDALDASGVTGVPRSAILEYMRSMEEGWKVVVKGLRASDASVVERGMGKLQEAVATVKKALDG